MKFEEFAELDEETMRQIRRGLSPIGKAACYYCDLGWSVIPLAPRSKVPMKGSGVGEECDDWRSVCWYWSNNPDCNVGIVTGSPSGGLVVIDVDQDETACKYGAESLFDWEQANGKLPETACATTGSGGTHYYYRTPTSIKSAVNRTLCIDRRGEGGYVVAPPSVHPDGSLYEWDLSPEDVEVAFADNKVLELIAYCDGGNGNQSGDGRFEFPEVVHDGEGREHNLVSYAFSLRSQGLDRNAIEAELSRVNQERVVPPKPERDIKRIAKSACRKPAGLSPEYAAAKKRAEERHAREAELAAQEYEERLKAAEAAGVENVTEAAPIDPADFRAGKSGLNHALVGEDMVSRFRFCFVDGVPAVWTGARYATGWVPVKRVLAQYKHSIKESERKEVCAWLEINGPHKAQAPWRYIAFENGVLNLETMELTRRNPDIIIPNVVPHAWKPDASSELVEKFLSDVACADSGVYDNLCEIIGLSMCRGCFMDKAFFLVNSRGCNGKSTFMNFLSAILGEDNFASVDPQTMGKRFQTVPLMGTLANIADDIPKTIADADGLAVFKKAVSGDFVPYEIKSGAAGKFKPYCTFVFSMNEVPALADSSGGMMRRIHPVPFDADFRGPAADRFIGEKLAAEECCEAAIVLGVAALRRMMETGTVTETDFSREQVAEIELDNNQVKLFLDECGWDESSLCGTPTRQLYDAYRDWAEESGIRNAFSARRFQRCVKEETDFCVRKFRNGGKPLFRYSPR